MDCGIYVNRRRYTWNDEYKFESLDIKEIKKRSDLIITQLGK